MIAAALATTIGAVLMILGAQVVSSAFFLSILSMSRRTEPESVNWPDPG